MWRRARMATGAMTLGIGERMAVARTIALILASSGRCHSASAQLGISDRSPRTVLPVLPTATRLVWRPWNRTRRAVASSGVPWTTQSVLAGRSLGLRDLGQRRGVPEAGSQAKGP
jgi:hypothetical protein